MQRFAYFPIDTPVGRLGILCDDTFIIRLLFPSDNLERELQRLKGECDSHCDTEAGRLARHFADELNEYFAGRRKRFTVAPALVGTRFERAVWGGILRLPYGETVSYSRLATMCGVHGARAVGRVVGLNPVPILVPCHRVVRQDGSLGGYHGGPAVKARLLALERNRED